MFKGEKVFRFVKFCLILDLSFIVNDYCTTVRSWTLGLLVTQTCQLSSDQFSSVQTMLLTSHFLN